MLSSEADAQSHPEECCDEDEIREVGGDADLRAEPPDERKLQDEDRERGERQLDGGAAGTGAAEGSVMHRRNLTGPRIREFLG
jgi:hypothetical protein